MTSKAFDRIDKQQWCFYECSYCGGVVSAVALVLDSKLTPIIAFFPAYSSVDKNIPERARTYLAQAKDSLHAPAGAVMLAASSVDAMLKARELDQGTLYERIEAAVTSNMITQDMGQWAHEVRLDANEQRHADPAKDLPSPEDAARVIEFAEALADVLFVLPARVRRGISKASGEDTTE